MPRLSREKLAVIFLAVFSVSFIVLFTMQLRDRLRSPFVVSGSVKAAATSTVDMTKDTDHDGLSDYDELNKYGTSPYLADTDSDGIPDGVEVANGTDPTCPQGKDCSKDDLVVASSTASSSLISSDDSASDDSASESAASSDTSSSAASSSDISASMLRQFLLDNKIIDKTTLDKISDADILASYQEAMAEGQASGTASTTASTASGQ